MLSIDPICMIDIHQKTEILNHSFKFKPDIKQCHT